jgi:transposase
MHKNNIRKTKTDKVDTFVIAKTLMMQESLRFITLKDLDYIELKELGRFRQRRKRSIMSTLTTIRPLFAVR